MDPTMGRMVRYVLRESDVKLINAKRAVGDAGARQRAGLGGTIGNDVREGDEYAAMVVRVFPGAGRDGECNLQVFLDGEDTFWACSRKLSEGGEPGTWHWPPRTPF